MVPGSPSATQLVDLLRSIGGNIKEIDFSNKKLKQQDCSIVIKAVTRRKHIKRLNLSNNDFGAKNLELLAKHIGAKDCSLTHLMLDRANLTDGDTNTAGVISFGSSLTKNKSLIVLSFKDN